MRKPVWAVPLLLALAALPAVTILLASNRSADGPGGGAEVRKPELAAAPVVRTDLRRVEAFPAVLRYTAPRTIMTGMGGTVTRMPEEGAELGRGDALFEIDGQPVFLFYGERPMWRPLALGPDGSAMSGPDVEQLEVNLAALGYASPDSSPPDQVFDRGSARLVRRWRAEAGLEAGGYVEQGRIVYAEDRIRVDRRLVEPGAAAAPGDPVAAVSGTGQEVHLELPAARRGLIEEGQAVTVQLPDGAGAGGSVLSIGAVRSDPDDRRRGGYAEVSIVLDDPRLGEEFGGQPVEVEIVAEEAAGVLAVPIKALLALAEGGYAVEVRRGGEDVLTAVETGLYAGGLVEVEGDLAAGDSVVVPK